MYTQGFKPFFDVIQNLPLKEQALAVSALYKVNELVREDKEYMKWVNTVLDTYTFADLPTVIPATDKTILLMEHEEMHEASKDLMQFCINHRLILEFNRNTGVLVGIAKEESS